MKKIDLSGIWNLVQAGNLEAVPMRIPGDNYTALIESGRIPNPYIGKNELDTLWVGREHWIISKSFKVDEDFLKLKNIYLHIESLDTFAQISINNQKVMDSCNMFHRIRIDIAGLLKTGENRIEILISSPEKTALKVSRTLSYEIPHTESTVQSKHINLIRKVQCHGGWDWGPCLMVSGIYGGIYIASCETGRIEYVHTNQRRKGKDWELEVTVEIFSYNKGETALEISLENERLKKSIILDEGLNTCKETLLVKDPELWWPAGYGKQPLYTLKVKIAEDELSKRIGFRTIDVISEEDDIGRSMTFKVNGREIFCKGANWIPMDALPGLETEERYDHLLTDAVLANMNMLRVWGGGKYEPDIFYDLCDRKGILVWHDFMFSCALYPSSQSFLSSVEEEVCYQVKRLKDHPCIALWCGNNECIGSLNWFDVSKKNRDRYLVDYDRLYEGVIGKAVNELDPLRTWWSSSPSGGPQDYSDCWHDDSRGDMHYWSVWHEGKDFESYYDITPRFCSEFGFQSFPSLSTVKSYADKDQLNLSSPVMEHHQRNDMGNTIIISTLSRYFRFPEKFKHFLYLSQVQQVLAMKTAVEYWRSRRPVCMGSLYWQINDNWPVASWSSIEYPGKWKLLHYAAKRFYEPVHLAVFVKNNTLEVWGLNDTETPYKGTLIIQFLDFSGSPVLQEDHSSTLQADAATMLMNMELSKISFRKEEVFFHVQFKSENIYLDNDIFLTRPKQCCLAKPEISLRMEEKEGLLTVVLTSDCPAFYVSLDPGSASGIFSDNCFTLLPGKKKEVTFSRRKKIDRKSFTEELKLYHLRDTYT